MKFFKVYDDVSEPEGDLYRVNDEGVFQFDVNGEWIDSCWKTPEELGVALGVEGFRIEEVGSE